MVFNWSPQVMTADTVGVLGIWRYNIHTMTTHKPMNQEPDPDNDINSLEKLALETAKIPWKELQYFFASGHAVHVSTELDLVRVARHVANDDRQVIESWMQAGKITPVANAQAREWHDHDAQVWAVVVRPWILIQDDKQGRKTQ